METQTDRRVVKCLNESCLLNQFQTVSGNCRRCERPLPNIVLSLISEDNLNAIDWPDKPKRRGGQIMHGEFWVCERLKKIRKLTGMTQTQACAEAGVQRTYVSKVENGHCVPNPKEVVRILVGTGMGIRDFLLENYDGPELIRRFQKLSQKKQAATIEYVRSCALSLKLQDSKSCCKL